MELSSGVVEWYSGVVEVSSGVVEWSSGVVEWSSFASLVDHTCTFGPGPLFPVCGIFP